MALDSRGGVSVVEIIYYIPILVCSIILVARYGFKREGWLYLLLLSIIRIAGGVTHVSYELSKTQNTTMRIVFSVMEAAGVSPLLLAALGFLGTIKQYGFEDVPHLRLLFRIIGIAAHVALALTVSGGVTLANNTDPSKVNHGVNLRHIGVIIFLVVFVLIVIVTAYLWINKYRVMKHRQTLLLAVTASLPFLAVRVFYTVLSAYAPTGIPGVNSGSSSLSAFNSTTGNFLAYLVMSVIMEMVAVLIYVIVGLVTPLQQDFASSVERSDEEDAMKLNSRSDLYATGGQQSFAYVPQR